MNYRSLDELQIIPNLFKKKEDATVAKYLLTENIRKDPKLEIKFF